MQVQFARCAGIDVHKDSCVVCVIVDGRKEVRTFGATTEELLRLRDWLEQERVTHVAMESTGVYWQPVYNILEGVGEAIWLVNAQHVKNLPGRKTDVKDCEWLADLLRHGLVKPSFVPDAPMRDLRDLTRHRTQLIGERSSEVNRVQKVLEGANLKLGSVLTDVMGTSGRAILDAIVAGKTDPVQLADLAVERVKRTKRDELVLALQGRVRDHHRFMLKTHLDHIDYLDELIEKLSKKIGEMLSPFEETFERLDEVVGIGRQAVEIWAAEVGFNMSPFETDGHLASWAKICPGNNQSAGKRLKGKTQKGSRWLRTMLIQCAWAAVRNKKSRYRSQFMRLRGRRGPKKAIVAVAHSILVTIYHMLKDGTHYRELGPLYLDAKDKEHAAKRLARRLEGLGYRVTLTKDPAA